MGVRRCGGERSSEEPEEICYVMSDYHSPVNMKKDFSGRSSEGVEGGSSSRNDQRIRGLERSIPRGRSPGGDGTRCQEYKTRDKGDAGHICDS